MPDKNTNYKYLSTHHLQHDAMNMYKDKHQSLQNINQGCPPVNNLRSAQYTPDYLVNRTTRLAASGRANWCQEGNGNGRYEFWNPNAGRCVGRTRAFRQDSCPDQSCLPCYEKLSGV